MKQLITLFFIGLVGVTLLVVYKALVRVLSPDEFVRFIMIPAMSGMCGGVLYDKLYEEKDKDN